MEQMIAVTPFGTDKTANFVKIFWILNINF